jgi:hypothetical protein
MLVGFAGAATFAGDVTIRGTCTGCGSTLYGGTDNADCNKITEKDPTFGMLPVMADCSLLAQ